MVDSKEWQRGAADALRARSASEDAPGDEVAPRLEQRTHLDSGRFQVTLRDYGGGLGEVGWSFVPSARPAKSLRGTAPSREQHEDRAIRRARSRIRQLVLAASADHLLTLTYRENVVDFERSCSDVARFVRLIRRQQPGWVYVAVAERQKRGAWHWHLAVRGRQDVQLLRAAWRCVVGEGNIDVVPPRGSGARRSLALVRYLSKYLTKGFETADRALNRRRFRASLGIAIPTASIPVPPECRADVAAFACEQLATATGSVGFVWRATDRAAGWACSWRR